MRKWLRSAHVCRASTVHRTHPAALARYSRGELVRHASRYHNATTEQLSCPLCNECPTADPTSRRRRGIDLHS